MMNRPRVLWLAVSTILFIGCRPDTIAARISSERPVRMGASQVLVAGELTKVNGTNALDAVQQLRPSYLRTRGSREGPAVFVDQMLVGDVSALRLIPIASIKEIRHLESAAATQKFGPGFPGGVIQVLTAAGKLP